MKVNFKISLTEGQKELYSLFRDKAVREIVAVWSRQCGKTVMAEVLAIQTLISYKCTVGYISPDYSQGKKVYKDIVALLQPTGLIAKKNSSDLTLELTNGSELKFFSAKNATAMRGQTISGLLIIDECAFIPDTTPDGQHIYHNIIKPITKARKPKILFISTPNGKSGFFYEKYLEAQSSETTKLIVKTIYDDKLISEEDIEELKRNTPPLAFNQEFLVQFLDSSLTAFQGFEKQFCSYKGKEKGKKVWIGVDFSANGEDETVLTKVYDNMTVEQYVIKGTLDDKYNRIADMIDSTENLVTAYMESNSIGEVMINEIRKRAKRKGKCNYYTTTHTNKNENVGLLATAIANRGIWFNEEEKELYQQFGVFTYMVNKNTRSVTYAAKPPYHDDRIMSLMIAMRAKEDYPSTSVTSNYRLVGTRDNKII